MEYFDETREAFPNREPAMGQPSEVEGATESDVGSRGVLGLG